MPIKKTKNHIVKWSVGKYLIFITILVLAFSIVISRQEQANQKKKSNNNQNSEDEEPKFIILKDGDESELESLPEEFKQKIKEALSKVKNLNLPSEQEANALNNNIPDQQQGKPSQSAKPTSQIEETTDTSMLSDISIPLDEIIIPTEYSSTLDEEFTRIKRMKELKLVTRRKFMSKKLNDLRKQQENETHQKKDSTEKLLEARMILDPDLQVYEKEAVEKAIGIYLSVIKEDPTNPLVLYNLGTLYKSEKFGVKDFSKSKMYYILASYLGSQMSQFEVALLYSNNLISSKDLENVKNLIIELFGPVETMKKQIKLIYEKIPQSMENTETLSLLNLFYSSLGGNTEANIALGYRHMFGHGVPKSCKTASYYYSKAAADIISEFEDSRMPLIDHVRLNDETAIQNKQSQEDIMEYYQYSASKGSSSSMLIYGYANLYGIRGVEQNGEVARRLFEQAAEAGEHEAFGALGNMFLKGAEGIPKSNETAFKYFKKGADKKDPSSLNGLGKMYLEGSKDEQGNVILEKNFELAAGYFNKSASLGNSEAHYNLGLLYLDGKGVKKSFKQAMQHFAISAQHGQVLAKYQLANMYLHGLGTNPNCEIAVKFLKSVVEKASWTSLMESAFEKFVSGEDQHTALLLYQHAAEMGIEIAQANLAFMYDRGYGFEEISSGLSEEESELLKFKGAIKWYQQAAEQGNVDAYVKVGDYYYYGSSALSSSNSSVGSLEQSFEKSIYFYRRAKELNNAQAMFNLGYMHEHGKGLPQDFHLAKRYYDMASDADPVAYVPVIMALGKLYAHWGFYLAKDYVSNILDGGMTSSEIIDETSNSDISTWLINLIIEHEDYFLAILIGGLALLIFVRHVVNSQANARPRRRRPATENAQQQENVANNEQAQLQEELHEHQE